MTEHLKGDDGESGTQPVLKEAHAPSSTMSQLSTKDARSSDMEEKEDVRAITGFKVCKIYPELAFSELILETPVDFGCDCYLIQPYALRSRQYNRG